MFSTRLSNLASRQTADGQLYRWGQPKPPQGGVLNNGGTGAQQPPPQPPRPPPPPAPRRGEEHTDVEPVTTTALPLHTPRSPRSEEDLEECIAAWALSCQANQATGDQRFFPQRLSSTLGLPAASGSSTARLSSSPGGPVLRVNIGGEVFRTTASTLRRAPFFDSMLRHAEEGILGTTTDSEGRLFVDRSGELFHYILAYLQTGHWLLRERSTDSQFVDALRDEAVFFGLDPQQDRLPYSRTMEYATVWQFQEDTSLYVDCLEQTIREDPDHQGLFRLCKYSGGLPLDQQTCTKRFKATSHSVQSVIAYFAMRGFALRHVVEGPMITHTTSADGQNRSGHGVQYILSRLSSCTEYSELPPPQAHRDVRDSTTEF
eukprot:TRINITY_DN112211_c0_g1_i1.p1 TRINITY_DN112211_c0_g1~~TRINITY_DN112211_c0_g1_i1.p1  ORF type:complete len:374 (+),score=41.11 TRINITY_DN112211_c0_g1_i1:127-1248(+)